MTESTNTTVTRVGADGAAVEPSTTQTDVVVAEIPGADPSRFVSVTLSNPLSKRDREFLGLPLDASTEVGQRLRVSKNGAKAIIHAGYATVDPEDTGALRAVVAGAVESAAAEDPAPVVPVEDEVALPDVEASIAPVEDEVALPEDAPEAAESDVEPSVPSPRNRKR